MRAAIVCLVGRLVLSGTGSLIANGNKWCFIIFFRGVIGYQWLLPNVVSPTNGPSRFFSLDPIPGMASQGEYTPSTWTLVLPNNLLSPPPILPAVFGLPVSIDIFGLNGGGTFAFAFALAFAVGGRGKEGK